MHRRWLLDHLTALLLATAAAVSEDDTLEWTSPRCGCQAVRCRRQAAPTSPYPELSSNDFSKFGIIADIGCGRGSPVEARAPVFGRALRSCRSAIVLVTRAADRRVIGMRAWLRGRNGFSTQPSLNPALDLVAHAGLMGRDTGAPGEHTQRSCWQRMTFSRRAASV
jgi:hypothetical protein